MLKKYWIPGLWLLCVPLYAWAGVSPDQYAEAVLHTHPAYPWGGVLSAIAITAVEALGHYALIPPKTDQRSAKRPAAAPPPLFPGFCGLAGSAHPPPGD